MNTQELPANQLALADAFKVLARGRKRTKRQHLDHAESVMTELRELGFRIVPFPPLKVRKRAKNGRRGK